MLKKITVQILLLLLAGSLLFSCVSCDIFKELAKNDVVLNTGYVSLSERNAPKITVSNPQHDTSAQNKRDSSLFDSCIINVTSKGGRYSDAFHWLYQNAKITLTIEISEKTYKVDVLFDEGGNLITNEYTIDLKKPLSANEIATGTELTDERVYSGGVTLDGVLHEFKFKTVEREILTANADDPCNSYTYTEDTCQVCGYHKTWRESPPAGHDFDGNNICTRCQKTRAEVDAENGVETTVDTKVETSKNNNETEQKQYIVATHWGSIEYKSVSNLGQKETKLLQISDMSAVHSIYVESSNIHVIKVGTAKITDRDRGIIEIPYEVYGYGEAVMTVSIVYDSPDKDNDVKHIKATFYVSQQG